MNVSYSYSYQGQQFEGTRLGYGRDKWRTRLSRGRVDEIIRDIEARQPFIVYVDERDPTRSVLFDDRTGIIAVDTIFVTGVGGIFALVGAFSLAAELIVPARRRRRTR